MNCTTCKVKIESFKILNKPDQEAWTDTLNAAGKFDLLATGFLSSGICPNGHINTAVTPKEIKV